MKLPPTYLSLISVTAVLTAVTAVTADSPSGVSENVAKWIVQLDAADFDVREHASQQLFAAGAASIQPLEAAIARGNLEVVARGLQVLRELSQPRPGEADDTKVSTVRQQARVALDRLATSRSQLIARQAAAARLVVEATEQEIAMRTLRVLGAQVVQGSEFEPHAPVALVLGKNWRGKPGDLQHVAKLPQLVSLSVKRAKVTDADLAALHGMNSLQYLDLMYVNVGDNVIEHLVNLKSLQYVRLYGTRITVNGKSTLERSMLQRGARGRNFGIYESPVDYKQGAFLGVHCQPSPSPCMIRDVTPDSAADSADLRPGDVIFRYDGQPVRTFDDLRKLISDNRAGESKKLKVLRPGETLNKIHKLAVEDQLGIEAKPSPIGVAIAKLDPEGVAAKLELKVGDIITSYNGNGVPDMRELEALFNAQIRVLKRRAEAAPNPFEDRFAVEDTCSLTLARGAEELEKTVTFGEWDQAIRAFAAHKAVGAAGRLNPTSGT